MPRSLETRVTYTPLKPDGSKGAPVQLMMIGADGKPLPFSLSEPHGYESNTVAAIEAAKRYGVRVPRKGSSAGLVMEDGDRRVWSVDLGSLTPAQVKSLHEGLLPEDSARLCEVPLKTADEAVEVTDAMVLADAEVARLIAAVPVANAAAVPPRTPAMVQADEDKIKKEGRKRLEEKAQEDAIDARKAAIRVVATGHAAEAVEADNPAAPDEAVEAAAKLMVTDASHRAENGILSDACAAKEKGEGVSLCRKEGQQWKYSASRDVAWQEQDKLLALDRLRREYEASQRALEAMHEKLGAVQYELELLRADNKAELEAVDVLASKGSRRALLSADGDARERAIERLDQLDEAADVESGFVAVSMKGGVAAAAYHTDFDPDELMEDPVFAALARDVADEYRERNAHANGHGFEAEVDPLKPDATGSVFSEASPNLAERREIFQETWSRMHSASFNLVEDTRGERFTNAAAALMPRVVEEERLRHAQKLADKRVAVPPGVISPADRDAALAAIPDDIRREPTREETVYKFGIEWDVKKIPLSDQPQYQAWATLMRRTWAEVGSKDAAGQLTGYAKFREGVATEMAGGRAAAVAEATKMEVMRLLQFDPTGRVVVTPQMMAAKAQEIADLALAAHQDGHNGAAEDIKYIDFDGVEKTVTLDLQAGGGIIDNGAPAGLEPDAAENAAIKASLVAARDEYPVVVTDAMKDAKAQEIADKAVAAHQAALAAGRDASAEDITYTDFDGNERTVQLDLRIGQGIIDAGPALNGGAAGHASITTDVGVTAQVTAGAKAVGRATLDRACERDVAAWQAALKVAADGADVDLPYRAANGAMAHLTITAAQREALCLDSNGDPDPDKLRNLWRHDVTSFPAADRATVGALANVQVAAVGHYQSLELIHRQGLLVSPDLAVMERVVNAGVGPYTFDVPAPPAARVFQLVGVAEADVKTDGRVDSDKLAAVWRRGVCEQMAATGRVTPGQLALAQARAEQRFEAAVDRVAHRRYRQEAGTQASRVRSAQTMARMSHPDHPDRKRYIRRHGEECAEQLDRAVRAGVTARIMAEIKADAGRFPELTKTVPPGARSVVPDEQLKRLIEVVLVDHPDLVDWTKDPLEMSAANQVTCLDYVKAEVEDKFAADLGAKKIDYFNKMQRDNPEVALTGRAPQKWQSMTIGQQQAYWIQQGRAEAIQALCAAKLAEAKLNSAVRELEQDLARLKDLHAEVAAKREALLEAQRQAANGPKEGFDAWLQRKLEEALLAKQVAGMYFDDKGVLRDAEGNDVVDDMFPAGWFGPNALKDRIQMMESRHAAVKEVMDGLFDSGDGFSLLMMLLTTAVVAAVTKIHTGEAMTVSQLMSKEGQMKWALSGESGEKVLKDAEELVANSLKCDDAGKRTIELGHLKGRVSRPMLIACAAQALRYGFKADQIKGLDGSVIEDAQQHIMNPLREARAAAADKAASSTRDRVLDRRARAGRLADPKQGEKTIKTVKETTKAPKSRGTPKARRGRKQGATGKSIGARRRAATIAAREAQKHRSHGVGEAPSREEGIQAGGGRGRGG